MSYRGKVKNGVIVLDNEKTLPEGAEIELHLIENANDQKMTLYDDFKPIIGALKDLPDDAAVNYEHYMYGAPKQQP